MICTSYESASFAYKWTIQKERQKSNSAEKKYLQHQKIDIVEFIKFIVTLCVTLL